MGFNPDGAQRFSWLMDVPEMSEKLRSGDYLCAYNYETRRRLRRKSVE